MKTDFGLLGIMISLGLNFFLLYTRKQEWNTDKFRWLVTGTLFCIGIFGFSLIQNQVKDDSFLFWCLMTPLIYNMIDRLFKKISLTRNNRDFYLWLRGSGEIDDSFGGNNPHIKNLDIIFSLALLLIVVILPLVGIYMK